MFQIKPTVVKVFICIVAVLPLVASESVSNSIANEFIEEYRDSDEIEENSHRHLTDTIPGDPDTDYPTYKSIPKTAFSCKGKPNWGYYADIETGCQVFHICESRYSKISFLCPIGTIFNQRHLICDWWYNTECNDVIDLYNFDQVFNEELPVTEVLEDPNIVSDLNLASSGGNSQRNNLNSISKNRSVKRKQIKDNQ